MAKLLGEALASAYRQIADNLDAMSEGGAACDSAPAPVARAESPNELVAADAQGGDRQPPTDARKEEGSQRPMGMKDRGPKTSASGDFGNARAAQGLRGAHLTVVSSKEMDRAAFPRVSECPRSALFIPLVLIQGGVH